jgi:tRNA(Ile)-lysidine synthase
LEPRNDDIPADQLSSFHARTMSSMTSAGTDFLSRVAATILRYHLINPGESLVVGLSGGADSIALLDLLSRLPGYHLQLIAVHLNHCLRGVESDADEEFCRDVANRRRIIFESRRVDVKTLAAESRLNLEDAARRARIEYFDEISKKYRAAAVALAHHADDQAETVLMRLLRGSGMTGLSGMAYRNSRGYIRPLLDVARSDIERYLQSNGVSWREDASNSDPIYLRNRIRHQLLPLLEEYNPSIRTSLASTANLLSGDEALLHMLTEQAFTASCRVEERAVVCSLVSLRDYEPPLQRRIIRHGFKKLTGTLERIQQCHVDAVCECIYSDRSNSRLALPHGVSAIREYDRLTLMFSVDVLLHTDREVVIIKTGCYPLDDGSSLTVEMASAASFSKDPDSVSCDLARFPFPWTVRTFRPGDRIKPFGMQGRKKVKDLFIDKKIPLLQRSRIPLLWSGTDLLWIAGVCVSELCRIDAQPASLARVTWCR